MVGGCMFFLWVGFAIIIGLAAQNKKRSGFGWFIFAIFLSPIIAGIALMLSGHSNGKINQAQGKIFVENLEGLLNLKSSGIYSEHEYDLAKKKLIFELKNKRLEYELELFLAEISVLMSKNILNAEEIRDIKESLKSKSLIFCKVCHRPLLEEESVGGFCIVHTKRKNVVAENSLT